MNMKSQISPKRYLLLKNEIFQKIWKKITETLQKSENVTLECKKAKTEAPKSVWATYSVTKDPR